jgi:hypothetical protein
MHRKLASRPDIPGFVQGPFVDGLPYACEILGDDYTGFGDNDQHEKDCDYVAKANPTNILALLDEIDKLKAENAGLLHALTNLMRNFPTDHDMNEAGWDGSDIEKACSAHDDARAAIASARKQGYSHE